MNPYLILLFILLIVLLVIILNKQAMLDAGKDEVEKIQESYNPKYIKPHDLSPVYYDSMVQMYEIFKKNRKFIEHFDTDVDISHFSELFYYIDVEQVFILIRDLLRSHPELPIVSLGSGNGAVEYLLSKWCNNSSNWILLDPSPLSWSTGKLFMAPDYPRDKDLMEAKPEIYNNCILFLNSTDPRGSNYDEKCVKKLRPLFIILLTNLRHCVDFKSGTPALKRYLDHEEHYYQLILKYNDIENEFFSQTLLIYRYVPEKIIGSENVFQLELKTMEY
jgi:hypothetical protein